MVDAQLFPQEGYSPNLAFFLYLSYLFCFLIGVYAAVQYDGVVMNLGAPDHQGAPQGREEPFPPYLQPMIQMLTRLSTSTRGLLRRGLAEARSWIPLTGEPSEPPAAFDPCIRELGRLLLPAFQDPGTYSIMEPPVDLLAPYRSYLIVYNAHRRELLEILEGTNTEELQTTQGLNKLSERVQQRREELAVAARSAFSARTAEALIRAYEEELRWMEVTLDHPRARKGGNCASPANFGVGP